jgi:hypothetical protein
VYRLLVVLLACCGRVGFDAAPGDGAAIGDGKQADAPIPDAPTACVPDGFCVPTCGATDPDCQAVCGDGNCVGNAGETCKSCTADCRTAANVCGNGACQTGEDGNNCFTDCGPVPWTWTADEADLIVRINQARTQGTSCNGQPSTSAPALTLDTTLRAAARDLAWEETHLGGGMGFNRCNGQSIITFTSMAGASGSQISTSSSETTNAVRMTNWIANMSACPILMNPSHTMVGVGLAIEVTPTYVALFR